ncbi:MAG TPA: polysaccharide deacetylase family protein [Nitrospira sp.]|nr:polysaccharide deacetylase family protein [Nitrospira sp.]
MSIRLLAKTGLASLLRYGGLHALSRSLGRSTPLVLGYHMVVDDVRAYEGRAVPANLISVRMLERQLDWIGRRYRFVSPDELGARIEQEESSARPAAVVTFDDGYVGVYDHAFPLLRRKGIPAGVFVVTDTVGRPQLHLYDKLYLLLTHTLPVLRYSADRVKMLLEKQNIVIPLRDLSQAVKDADTLMRRLFTTLPQKRLRRAIQALEAVSDIDEREQRHLHSMTWDMIAALDRAGMTIGSHTGTHALLTLETGRLIAHQTAGSALMLQRMLGKPTRHFAYPDGRFNADVVDAVAAAGYRFAYTTCSHRDSRYPRLTIPRTLLWEKGCLDAWGRFSPSLMSYCTSPVSRYLSPCRQNHGSNDVRLPRAARGRASSHPWPAPIQMERGEC